MAVLDYAHGSYIESKRKDWLNRDHHHVLYSLQCTSSAREAGACRDWDRSKITLKTPHYYYNRELVRNLRSRSLSLPWNHHHCEYWYCMHSVETSRECSNALSIAYCEYWYCMHSVETSRECSNAISIAERQHNAYAFFSIVVSIRFVPWPREFHDCLSTYRLYSRGAAACICLCFRLSHRDS